VRAGKFFSSDADTFPKPMLPFMYCDAMRFTTSVTIGVDRSTSVSAMEPIQNAIMPIRILRADLPKPFVLLLFSKIQNI
jgi:hypothetical protein